MVILVYVFIAFSIQLWSHSWQDTKTFTHLAFFVVNMISFLCDDILMIVIESFIQWWFDVLLLLIEFNGFITTH
jgi:hypothetical protein